LRGTSRNKVRKAWPLPLICQKLKMKHDPKAPATLLARWGTQGGWCPGLKEAANAEKDEKTRYEAPSKDQEGCSGVAKSKKNCGQANSTVPKDREPEPVGGAYETKKGTKRAIGHADIARERVENRDSRHQPMLFTARARAGGKGATSKRTKA